MLTTICGYGWCNGQSQVQTQRWGGRLEKSQVARSAYLNHSGLRGHYVKSLPLHRTWARTGKSPLSMCLWQVLNVLDANGHKDTAWGVRGRVHGVCHGDFLSDTDSEGHQIQFPTAVMGSALHWHLGGCTSTVPQCLSGHPHKMLAYINSGKREWWNGCSTFHKRTR